MKQKVKLGAVQETLLIPLWARAVETKKKRPVMVDLKAAEILDRIDYDFSKFRKAVASQAGCCIRGLIMDRLMSEILQDHSDTLVVEIGAGLDTRYDRLEDEVDRWIDLDLPDSMALREQFFVETDKRSFLVGSVLEEEWIASVKMVSGNAPVLFVAEGVLMYFTEEQVQRLFKMLAEHFPGSWLVFDNLGTFMDKPFHRANASELNITEDRLREYRKRLKSIGIKRVDQNENGDVYFSVWASGFGGNTRHKGIAWVPEPPATNDVRNFVEIKDGWYIYGF